jgi:hypothetical protein
MPPVLRAERHGDATLQLPEETAMRTVALLMAAALVFGFLAAAGWSVGLAGPETARDDCNPRLAAPSPIPPGAALGEPTLAPPPAVVLSPHDDFVHLTVVAEAAVAE